MERIDIEAIPQGSWVEVGRATHVAAALVGLDEDRCLVFGVHPEEQHAELRLWSRSSSRVLWTIPDVADISDGVECFVRRDGSVLWLIGLEVLEIDVDQGTVIAHAGTIQVDGSAVEAIPVGDLVVVACSDPHPQSQQAYVYTIELSPADGADADGDLPPGWRWCRPWDGWGFSARGGRGALTCDAPDEEEEDDDCDPLSSRCQLSRSNRIDHLARAHATRLERGRGMR